jgi:transcriptional accessory protein Tex/SPT6
MAKDLKVTVNDLIANKENSLNKTGELHHSEIGLLTVRDIIKELENRA